MLSCPPATTIVALTGPDLLGRQRHGAQAGAADLVDAEGGLVVRQAGGARRLAGRVLPWPAVRTWPRITSSTPSGRASARASAA